MTTQRIQLRRGTANDWTSANPVLWAGEPGFETDSGKRKTGDGVTAWNQLKYDTDSSNLPDLSTVYDRAGAASSAQTAASSDATNKVASHAGSATAHARLQITDVLIHRTVNGAPTDAMFTNPVDGMEVVDTANARKWCRVGGNWVYTSLSSPPAFTPASLSGLVGWYDASQIAGLSDGAAVAQWNDLSGTGNHLTASGTAQPTYKANIQNGKPVVRFNGTTNVMAKTLSAALAAPYTVIVVGRASQGTAANECFWGGGASLSMEGRSAGYYALNSGSPNYAGLSTGTKLNAFVLITAVFSSTPVLRVNGVERDGTGWTAANAAAFYVGAVNGNGDWLNGDIAEVIIYNRALSASEISQVEGYLS